MLTPVVKMLILSLLLISSASQGITKGVASLYSAEGPRLSLLKSENPVPGRYIVKLKPSVSLTTASAVEHSSNITHRWKEWNGFAGNFSSMTVKSLLASPEIEFVEEDGIINLGGVLEQKPERRFASWNVGVNANKDDGAVRANTNADTTTWRDEIGGGPKRRAQRVIITQTDAPWGLARLSQDTKLVNQNPAGAVFTYRYDSRAGLGADVYVLDTGIFIEHTDFGGRARWGATFGGYASVDGNGHGTHCAATAVGTKYGVAKLANAIAVKVLSDAGSGRTSDIISGIDWIIRSSKSSGRPSVILAPIGGSPSVALDNSVVAATTAGVTFVTTAGNSGTNASNFSPGRVGSAMTVGGSTIGDGVMSGSNFGGVIDMFAPGQSVLSAWIGDVKATAVISGGSSAAAHVAGLSAYELGSEVECIEGVLTGVGDGTVNCLASNGVTRSVEYRRHQHSQT